MQRNVIEDAAWRLVVVLIVAAVLLVLPATCQAQQWYILQPQPPIAVPASPVLIPRVRPIPRLFLGPYALRFVPQQRQQPPQQFFFYQGGPQQRNGHT